MKDYKYDTKIMLSEYKKFFEDHKNDEKPFYANLGVIEIHRPFDIWSEPVDPKTVIVPPFLPESDKVREDLSLYYGIINPVDETIGKVLEILDNTGLRENTLFIYTTDHGSPFPRAKCTLYDPGIKTLLIMNCPNNVYFSGGKVLEQMISNIDLLPTLLDFIGTKIPDNIEGKSFLPILRNTNLSFRSEIFTEKTYHDMYDPMRSVRTRKYKYIRNFESSQYLYEMPIDIERSLSGQDLMDKIKFNRPKEEFYDLKADPLEHNNLAYNIAYNDALLELRLILDNWMKETNDPLLKGKVKDDRQKPPRKY
jgi:arylsulfatase A-like enzyme